MVLKPDRKENQKEEWFLYYWSDRGRTGGRTCDVINNLINNFKII